MPITTNAKKMCSTIIGGLLVLCLLSILSCSGGSMSDVHKQDLLQRAKAAETAIKAAEAAKTRAEIHRDAALQRAKAAETARDAARHRVKASESAERIAISERDEADERAKAAETAKARAQSELNTTLRLLRTAEFELDEARERAKAAETPKVRDQSERSSALQSLKTTETELRTALDRAKAAEVELDDAYSRLRAAESNLRTALRRVKAAEAAEQKVISERNKAREAERKAIVERDKARERAEIAENLIRFVPQAVIKDVRTDVKKKEMDISVTFSIKNRKDVDGQVRTYFYFQDGEKLKDKRGNQIVIWKKFTPKRVTETQTVKLSMPYDKLNTSQPSKLKFDVRIYDESAEDYLDQGPYTVSFSFYPNKDNPVQLTYR